MLESPGEAMSVDAVIIACGSCAYPQLGASHEVYELVRSIGHHVYEPFPAVLPVNIPLKILHRLEGIKWDCGVKALSAGKAVGRAMEDGVSGGFIEVLLLPSA